MIPRSDPKQDDAPSDAPRGASEKGVVRCTKDGETIRIRVGSGVASVENNEATLLVSDGERLE